MISPEFIRENPDKVKEGVKKKGYNVDIDKLINVEAEHRKLLHEVENFRADRNRISELISNKDKGSREKNLAEAEGIKKKLKEAESKLKEIAEVFEKLLRSVPNLPFDDVPVGKDENDNVVLRKEGKIQAFSFPVRDYLEISADHDLIDLERASKVAGSRFGYLKNEAVLLEFALTQFALDTLYDEGFIPIVPPVFIQSAYMEKLGYLATRDDRDEIYHLEKDDLYLVGTSEQSVVSMHADEILDTEALPRRYAAFSTCFRREAGSYGKDTKGILRVHQFDKVEMVSFAHPEKSREEHRYFLSLQEKLMKALEIPYQVVHISTGDTGFPMAEKFDIESWIPSENKYRETHSASNATDFQARRLNTRFKEKDKKGFLHTINGTAFAIGRTIIALLENHQQKDGSVHIPKALQRYTGFKRIG